MSKPTDNPETRWQTLLEYSQRAANGCLRYTGSKNCGYGMAPYRGKMDRVHRISWQVHHGCDVPQGKVICHAQGCYKDCFEPTHLTAKTQQENLLEDRIRDGTLPRGETHPRAKLSNEEALAIYNSKGNGTIAERAQRFSNEFSKRISFDIVAKIDQGETYSNATNDFRGRKRKRAQNRAHSALKREQGFTPIEVARAACLMLRKCSFEQQTHGDGTQTLCLISRCSDTVDGYTTVGVGRQHRRAHIVSHAFFSNNCRFPDNLLVVRHKCAVKTCVCPQHLEIGTHAQNARDRFDNSHRQVVSSTRLTCPMSTDCEESFDNDPAALAEHVLRAHIDVED